MATISKSFNDIKKDLRQLFMDMGWGFEIEGETPPYYRVYTTVLDFIANKFYDGVIPKEEDKPKVTKQDIVHIENKCPKCGSKWIYYKKTAREYKCRKCKNIWQLAEMEGKVVKVTKIEEKLLQPPKPKPDEGYYFKCEKCGKKRVLYRAKTKDYRCRECRYTFKGGLIQQKIKAVPSKPKDHYYFICKNCGRRRVIWRTSTKDYRCRVCKFVSKEVVK